MELLNEEVRSMEIAVKETYAHLVKDESLVQNSNKLYIVEFHFDQSWDGYAKSARSNPSLW